MESFLSMVFLLRSSSCCGSTKNDHQNFGINARITYNRLNIKLTFDSWGKCPFICFPSGMKEWVDALLSSWLTLVFRCFLCWQKATLVNHWVINTACESRNRAKNILCSPSHLHLLQTCLILKSTPEKQKQEPLEFSWPDQEHSPGGKRICVKVKNQEKTSPE